MELQELKNENTELASEKVSILIRRYSIPCIISLLVGALYNIVDQIFIANASYLGSFGNAANTVVFPLTVIALAVAVMVGDGCCAFVSLSLGAGKKEDADSSVGSAILVTLASSLVITAVYLLFQDPILTMFGARVNEETFALAKEYFFYISIGIPFYMFGQAMNPIIRSDGSPRYAMFSLLAGSVLNCILDPIFIFPLHWGMMGAAVATVLGQVVGAVLALAYLFHMKTIRLAKQSFRFRFDLLKRFLPLGITSFLAQISMVLSMAAVLNMIRKYGALDPVYGQDAYAQIPTAVVGIVMKFFQIVISIAIGLAAGCIPITGYNAGAGRSDRVREILRILLLTETLTGIVAFAVFELFPGQLIAIFGAGNESAYYTDFGVRCIRIFLSMIALACLNKGIMIFLQALGRAKESSLLSMLREIVCGVGLPILLPVFFGLDGILYFMAVSDIVTFIFSDYVLRKVTRRLEMPSADGVQKEKLSTETA
ncbi:MAG: MATE family efflux transporter [Lachnospiraceae bacterium]|jgi:putative MATE family efflux protein|nr:MATE family efflux transporter [Lachnospiraceae bacterium]